MSLIYYSCCRRCEFITLAASTVGYHTQSSEQHRSCIVGNVGTGLLQRKEVWNNNFKKELHFLLCSHQVKNLILI